MAIASNPCLSQDIGGFWQGINDRIAAHEYFKASGSVQLNLRFNQISGIPARTDPFSGRLNTALLIDFIGIKGPFSAAFSDGNLTYNLPAYAFYGFSPSYKWIQLHVGDRSMEFSPYSLSGHNFKGLGIELKPGKFYIGLMAGRLNRARIADAGAIQNINPVYKRIGRAIKVGFDDGKNALSAVIFHAIDDENSVENPDSSFVRPQENLVLEMSGKKAIGNLFDLSFDIAHSALTRDKTAPILQSTTKGLKGTHFGLFTPYSSTAYSQAWNFELAFRPVFAAFTIGVEHIGAGYQSLGRLSFLNDTEHINIGTTTSLFNDKVNLSAKLGIQKNGLSKATSLKGNRLIGSVNLSVNFSERLVTSLALSNFNYTMRQRISTVPIVVVDSIIIVQSNLSAQIASTYLLGAQKQSALSVSIAYQKANTITNEQIELLNEHEFYSAVVAYALNIEDRKWNITASCLLNKTDVGVVMTTIISPSLAVQKSLVNDQLSMNVGIAYSNVYTSNDQTNSVWETKIGGQWKVSKKHHLRCHFSYVNNKTAIQNIPTGFSDLNLQLAYQITF